MLTADFFVVDSFVFVLMLNVPVNNFSVMLGRSPRVLGITSTFRGVVVQRHNTAEVGIEPPTSRSGVRDSTRPHPKLHTDLRLVYW